LYLLPFTKITSKSEATLLLRRRQNNRVSRCQDYCRVSCLSY